MEVVINSIVRQYNRTDHHALCVFVAVSFIPSTSVRVVTGAEPWPACRVCPWQSAPVWFRSQLYRQHTQHINSYCYPSTADITSCCAVNFVHGTLFVNTDMRKMSNVCCIPSRAMSDRLISTVHVGGRGAQQWIRLVSTECPNCCSSSLWTPIWLWARCSSTVYVAFIYNSKMIPIFDSIPRTYSAHNVK